MWKDVLVAYLKLLCHYLSRETEEKNKNSEKDYPACQLRIKPETSWTRQISNHSMVRFVCSRSISRTMRLEGSEEHICKLRVTQSAGYNRGLVLRRPLPTSAGHWISLGRWARSTHHDVWEFQLSRSRRALARHLSVNTAPFLILQTRCSLVSLINFLNCLLLGFAVPLRCMRVIRQIADDDHSDLWFVDWMQRSFSFRSLKLHCSVRSLN